MFDLVDKEVYPEFARGLNKGFFFFFENNRCLKFTKIVQTKIEKIKRRIKNQSIPTAGTLFRCAALFLRNVRDHTRYGE